MPAPTHAQTPTKTKPCSEKLWDYLQHFQSQQQTREFFQYLFCQKIYNKNKVRNRRFEKDINISRLATDMPDDFCCDCVFANANWSINRKSTQTESLIWSAVRVNREAPGICWIFYIACEQATHEYLWDNAFRVHSGSVFGRTQLCR